MATSRCQDRLDLQGSGGGGSGGGGSSVAAALAAAASFVIDRVTRPFRRPWLLAVFRPLGTAGSRSSGSSGWASTFSFSLIFSLGGGGDTEKSQERSWDGVTWMERWTEGGCRSERELRNACFLLWQVGGIPGSRAHPDATKNSGILVMEEEVCSPGLNCGVLGAPRVCFLADVS